MNNYKYKSPIHRLLGVNIDISLICTLFLDANNTVIINGVEVIHYCPEDAYIDLEKHFYYFRGQNRIGD